MSSTTPSPLAPLALARRVSAERGLRACKIATALVAAEHTADEFAHADAEGASLAREAHFDMFAHLARYAAARAVEAADGEENRRAPGEPSADPAGLRALRGVVAAMGEALDRLDMLAALHTTNEGEQ